MKIQTIIIGVLLFTLTLGVQSCKSSDLPPANDDIQKELAKEKKKKSRAQKKIKKEEYKRFWSMQTKEARCAHRKLLSIYGNYLKSILLFPYRRNSSPL